MDNDLSLNLEDVNFLLFCLGNVYGSSMEKNEKYREFIKNNHDRILAKIINIHSELSVEKGKLGLLMEEKQ